MDTAHNNLSSTMDYLISEVLVIKEILLARINKPEEVPKNMTLEEAISFLLKRKIPMSKSKLYKLTSSNKIPYRKVGTKLIFYSDELCQWCNDQIINPSEIIHDSTLPIINNSFKKIYNHEK